MADLWMPGALRKPLERNFTNARRKVTDAIILHVAVSESASLQGWFNNPRAGASSHFYVRRDGTIEQYIPINKISWAGVRSDQRAISVETQGMGHGAWTPAQLDALEKIIRYCRSMYPSIPARIMASSKTSEKGIGWHRLGVPATSTQKLLGRSQTGGELWSGAVGKICPGSERIRQIPALVQRIAGTSQPVTYKKPAATPPAAKPVVSTVPVMQVQKQLAALGLYQRAIDGQAGTYTRQAVLAYQKNQRYFPGMLRDGNWGPLTQAHYEWVKTLQTTLNKWKTSDRVGKTKIDGDYGPFVDRLVRQTITDNFNGAYKTAVRAVFGRTARPVNDGQPGRAFCRMFNIKPHPTA